MRTPTQPAPRFVGQRFDHGTVFTGPDGFSSAAVGGCVAATVAVAGFAALGASLAGFAAGALSLVLGWLASQRAEFHLFVASSGCTLRYRLLGVTWRRVELPRRWEATREGLEDWGDDGPDGRQALCVIRPADQPFFDPLFIGTRDDASALPEAIAEAQRRHPPHPELGFRAAPGWHRRLHRRLARVRVARHRVAREPGERLTVVTPWAGLLDWELPRLGPALLVVGLATWWCAASSSVAFAALFTTVILSLWRLGSFLREDHADVLLDGHGRLRAIRIERRWLGWLLRSALISDPAWVLTGSWSAPHPVELATWQRGTVLQHHRIPLVAETAATFQNIERAKTYRS